jgi:ArsR family transcriptional regulator, arsenate/arsenite/antimonite-responsive transcriptional repressor
MNQLTDVFKVLSDETRLRIVVLLTHEDLCVCQLSGVLKISQPKISKHLAKLRDLGFVADERREKFVYYRLRKENQFLIDFVNNISGKIDEFPQLISDRCGLAEKEKYLNQCRCNLDS